MKNKGQTLIELLITIGLSAILIPALLAGFSITRSGRAQQEQRLQATSYLKEAQEAVRIVDSNNWDNLVDGTYHPIVSGTTWALAAGSETISGFGFIRQIVIGDVFRDVSGNIVTSGGVLDPSTKKITVSVSWTNPISSSVSSDSYLTRHKNFSHLETTVADFTAGISTATVVVATTGTNILNDGQVELGSGGGNSHGGDWCAPNLNLTSVSLPQASSTNAIYAIPGEAFVGIGDISSQGSGTNFVTVNITQSYPPSAQLGPTLEIDNVYGDFGDSQYAYFALDRTSNQMQIVDTITGNKITQKGYFSAAPTINTRGTSVYVVGTTAYLTAGNKLFTIDMSPARSACLLSNVACPQLTGSTPVTLAGTSVKVIVVGSYAYVINSASSSQFQIINLSNYTVIGSKTLNNQPARDLAVNATGDRAYVVTKLANGQNTFYIINTDSSHKNNPAILASTGTNGMDPHGVNLVTGNKAIVVGLSGTTQYQVFNIGNDIISVCGSGLSIPSGVYGVASVLQQNGDAYSYITTGDSHFRVILGGNGSAFNSAGIFESATFDSGKEAAWNTISATVSAPLNTTLRFKVALKHSINNSCSGVSFSNSDFVGPDGQTSSYFSAAGGVLPFDNNGAGYENPARCERYRVYLTTNDPTKTPIVYNVALSYSP